MIQRALLSCAAVSCPGFARTQAAVLGFFALHRDVDRNPHVGIPAVEQVITVVDVGHVNVVGVVTSRSPSTPAMGQQR